MERVPSRRWLKTVEGVPPQIKPIIMTVSVLIQQSLQRPSDEWQDFVSRLLKFDFGTAILVE